MKILNSIVPIANPAGRSSPLYTLLREIEPGGLLSLGKLIPALPGTLVLRCTKVDDPLYYFTASYVGIPIGTAQILLDGDMMAIALEES